MHSGILRTVIVLAAVLLLGAIPPAPGRGRVHDLAGTLDTATVGELEALAGGVEQATGAEFAIVTVPSLDGMTVDEYANKLFNGWGIGKRRVNNGVLFLIAPSERRVRIEVGYGLEPLLTDSLCGEILDTEVVPQFKRGEMIAGIKAGAARVADILERHPEAARGIPDSLPSFVRTPRRDALALIVTTVGAVVVLWVAGWILVKRESFPTWFFALSLVSVIGFAIFAAAKLFTLPADIRPDGFAAGGIGAALAGLYSTVRRYFRYGPHHCTKCSARLTLLRETDDDSKLTEVQKLEESLGSVDYDVWYCPSCLHTDTERYVSFWSRFKDCPKCAHRTMKEESVTLESATTYSTGRRRVTGDCVSCKHHTSRIEIIPKISKSSSSGGGGGGGFGGGSSGGGGASRGW